MVFFEKKNQKTFCFFIWALSQRATTRHKTCFVQAIVHPACPSVNASRGIKVFLLLFLQKKKKCYFLKKRTKKLLRLALSCLNMSAFDESLVRVNVNGRHWSVKSYEFFASFSLAQQRTYRP
jgi:hypothetical protein